MRYLGNIIHDCWASYLPYEHCNHGLCGSHLLRELTFIIEANGYAWARNMKRLLQEACVEVSKSPEKKLQAKQVANLQKRYRNILTRGAKELPAIPLKTTGKRGKLAKSDAHNLLERLQRHEASVLRFTKEPSVSFTNNRAERDLRMSKVKQKVQGAFGPKIMPRRIAAFQAICKLWQIRDITRSLLCNWLWRVSLMFREGGRVVTKNVKLKTSSVLGGE